MNDFDRENVNFLLNASKEDMEDWYLHATEDDYNYALEIIRRARTELEMQELELIDGEIEYDDLIEARSVLSKFALK